MPKPGPGLKWLGLGINLSSIAFQLMNGDAESRDPYSEQTKWEASAAGAFCGLTLLIRALQAYRP